ncbi:beta-microseminoprotein-like [Ascaphus truei]|uniref:beta-microseminoprotein-like n=1 Tax=Ascaphus truei TaxID=8439 RepID=UPI003F596296
MKCILAVLIACGIFVSLCHAACFTQILERTIVNGKLISKGCEYNGEFADVGTRWRTKNCLDCDCGSGSMSCCNAHGWPFNYNKKECKVVYDKEACTVTVVKKKNPSIECAHSSVG